MIEARLELRLLGAVVKLERCHTPGNTLHALCEKERGGRGEEGEGKREMRKMKERND